MQTPKSMSKLLGFTLAPILAIWLALAGLPAQAAGDRPVLPFAANTWAALVQSLPRPAAVVFSTSDCSHCPKVIEALADGRERSGKQAVVAVVVMDGAEIPDLASDPHFRRADRLYVFSGNETALRYAVNPDWRGLTPYVALLPVGGGVRFHTGPLSAEARKAFFAGR